MIYVVPSIGQPRDSFNLAGYAVYDDVNNEVELLRVPYLMEKDQNEMKDKRFPKYLINRLEE